jgi:hypothetical protein
MIFTWSGKGYMVPLSAALSTIGLMVLTSRLDIQINDQLLSATAAVLSGMFVWILHRHLAQQKSGVSVVDDETGESTPFIVKHDFFWIPLKYWALIFTVGGILAAIDALYPMYLGSLVAGVFNG